MCHCQLLPGTSTTSTGSPGVCIAFFDHWNFYNISVVSFFHLYRKYWYQYQIVGKRVDPNCKSNNKNGLKSNDRRASKQMIRKHNEEVQQNKNIVGTAVK
jgi:hypothetical protein